MIQSANVIFNLYFVSNQVTSLKGFEGKGEMKPLIEIGARQERVFSGSREIVEWGLMNRVVGRQLDVGKGEGKKDDNPNNGKGENPNSGKDNNLNSGK